MLKKVKIEIVSRQMGEMNEINGYTLGLADSRDDEIESEARDEDEDEDEDAEESRCESGSVCAEAAQEREKEEDPPEIRMSVSGKLRVRDGEVALSYRELDENGFENTETRLVFREDNPELVTVMHEGEVDTAFVFSPGDRNVCVYTTPFGPIEMTVRTNHLENRLLDGGFFHVNYAIEMRGGVIGLNDLELRVTTDCRAPRGIS